jgi:hypothetical protein
VWSINSLLSYVNCQSVGRAANKDKGWLRFGGIVPSEFAKGPTLRAAAAGLGMIDDGSGCTGSHNRIAEKMRERRAAELRR